MFRSLATSAVALIAAASPGLTEVTPAQVWDDLARSYTDMGYEVTVGSRDEAGDTLSLSDVTVSVDGETSDVSFAIPGIVLRQTGDAKVRTVIEGEITGEAVAEMPDQDDTNMQFLMTMPGNEMLSSGSADDMLHEMSYPELTLAARFGAQPEDAGAAQDMPLRISLADVAGTYRNTKAADGTDTTYDMTAGNLDLAIEMTDVAAEDQDGASAGSLSARSVVDGLTMTGRMKTPSGQMDMTDNLHVALKDGLRIDGNFAMGPMTGSAEFSGTDAEGVQKSGDATFGSDSSELSVAMSRDALIYRGSAKDTRAEMNIADLPFPISYAVESAAGGLPLPISKSDESQPFKFDYALAGLTLADGIWNLFDPNGQLPRDPASLTIDIEGMAKVSEDLLDPAMAQRMEEAAEAQAQAQQQAEAAPDAEDGAAAPADAPPMPSPLRPETVRINQFTLDAVGAKADVTGDLTIPEGAEQPVGKVEGSFAGINTLLDTLVSMGVVPQEQVMGARMMIAMFARPAEGDPNTLKTELDFREDGSIFANGQQVK